MLEELLNNLNSDNSYTYPDGTKTFHEDGIYYAFECNSFEELHHENNALVDELLLVNLKDNYVRTTPRVVMSYDKRNAMNIVQYIIKLKDIEQEIKKAEAENRSYADNQREYFDLALGFINSLQDLSKRVEINLTPINDIYQVTVSVKNGPVYLVTEFDFKFLYDYGFI